MGEAALVNMAPRSSRVFDVRMVYAFDCIGGGTRTERVCAIDNTSQSVLLIEVFSNTACPHWMPIEELDSLVQTGSAKVTADPFAHLRCPDAYLSKASIRERDHRYAALERLLSLPIPFWFEPQGTALVKEIYSRNSPGAHMAKRKAYELRRIYLQRGLVKNALLPGHWNAGYTIERRKRSPPKFRPGRKYKVVATPAAALTRSQAIARQSAGIAISEELKDLLFPLIRELRETLCSNGHKRGWKDIQQTVCERHFFSHREWPDGKPKNIPKPATQCPSINQIKNIYRERHHPAKALISLYGESEFARNHRALTGDRRDLTRCPGQVVQIDFTIPPVLLLNITRRYILGRPCVATIWDTASSLVLGFAVTWRRESWTTGALAIINMVTDKTEWCAKFGIDCPPGSWPSCLFEVALTDNGAMISKGRENLHNSLGCDFDNTASERGDQKGLVEHGFAALDAEFILHQPGAVQPAKGIRAQREAYKHARKTADLTIQDLIKRLAAYYHARNHQVLQNYKMSDDMMGEVAAIPIELWKYGVAKNGGRARIEDINLVRMHCLPQGFATITEDGAVFADKTYSSPEIESEGLAVKGRHKRWKIPVLYHPMELSTIYWARKEAKRGEMPDLVPLQRTRTEGDHLDISLYELERAAAHQKTLNLLASDNSLSATARLDAYRGSRADGSTTPFGNHETIHLTSEERIHARQMEDIQIHQPAIPHPPSIPSSVAVRTAPRKLLHLDDLFGEDEAVLN